jgi:hypothetical protein
MIIDDSSQTNLVWDGTGDANHDGIADTKKVKALCRDDLRQEERRLVTQAHDFFEARLRKRVI